MFSTHTHPVLIIFCTYILVTQVLHMAQKKSRLANCHGYVPLYVEIEIRLDVADGRRQLEVMYARNNVNGCKEKQAQTFSRKPRKFQIYFKQFFYNEIHC